MEKLITTDNLQHLKTGLYEGKNEDGKRVIVLRQEGDGWTVKTLTKPKWWEVVYYNEDGSQEGVTYEPNK